MRLMEGSYRVFLITKTYEVSNEKTDILMNNKKTFEEI